MTPEQIRATLKSLLALPLNDRLKVRISAALASGLVDRNALNDLLDAVQESDANKQLDSEMEAELGGLFDRRAGLGNLENVSDDEWGALD